MVKNYQGAGKIKKPFYKKWWIWVIVVLLIIGIVGSLGDDSENQTEAKPAQEGETVAVEEAVKEYEAEEGEVFEVEEDKVLTFGDEIEIDNFIIVFEKYEVVDIDNQFADYEDAIVVSAKITNIDDETQSMIMLTKKLFTPNGTETEDISAYLMDDYKPFWHDDLRKGATYEGHLVGAYEGDGEYIIELSPIFGDAYELFFDVVK